VQRHVTVENYLDCWAFNRYHGGASVSRTLRTKLSIPQPGALPQQIVALIDASLRAVYPDIAPTLLGARFPSQAEIQTTYAKFHEVLILTEKMIVDRPAEPFAGVQEVLARALEDLLQTPPAPPDLGTTCSVFQLFTQTGNCFDNFLDNAQVYLEWLGELVLWTLETLADVVDLILATLLAMPITALLALLYGIQLLLYQAYQNMRRVLAEHGFVFPEPDDLQTGIGTSLVSTALSCGQPFKYPVNHSPNRSHLVCSAALIEQPATACDFHAFSASVTPDSFIEGVPFSEASLAEYAQSPSPNATRQLEQQKKRIGNAVEMAAWMIKKAATPSTTSTATDIAFADWNLDSDRGYGYKAWTGQFAGRPPAVTAEAFV
jgi:hypothetical protein